MKAYSDVFFLYKTFTYFKRSIDNFHSNISKSFLIFFLFYQYTKTVILLTETIPNNSFPSFLNFRL